MQGRARGRKGERKTYHINPYHHITMEFGTYLLNVAKKPTRARARKGEAQGVLSYQKATGIFDNPHVYIIHTYHILYAYVYINVSMSLFRTTAPLLLSPLFCALPCASAKSCLLPQACQKYFEIQTDARL